jgi:hypothetical protein
VRRLTSHCDSEHKSLSTAQSASKRSHGLPQQPLHLLEAEWLFQHWEEAQNLRQLSSWLAAQSGHQRTLRLEVTLGLMSGLAVPPLAVNSRDADVQRSGAVCREIARNPNTANRGTLTIFSNRNRSKIVPSARNQHVWLRFRNWRREWDSNFSLTQGSKFSNVVGKSSA